MKRHLAAFLGLILLAGFTLSGPQAAAEETRKSGVDRSGFDQSVRPQDDFNQYVNGGWIDKTEIPADKSNWGSFTILREDSDKHQHEIIENLAGTPDLPPNSEERKIGDLYASLMDAEKINALGAAPLERYLEGIDQIETSADLQRAFAQLRKVGLGIPLFPFINVDSGDSKKYAVYLTQAGLGLPNRNYYLDEGEKFENIRTEYPIYMAKMFGLAGLDHGEARAKAIYDLEMKLAEAHWPPEDNRDASKTDNRYDVGDLEEVSDEIEWHAFLAAAGLGSQAEVFVRQPSYAEKLGELLTSESIETWKNYLRFHLINGSAQWMSDDFSDTRFAFFGTLVNGQQELEPRWQRAVQVVNFTMGEAVGKVYVQAHYPPHAKKRMDELVKNLLVAFEESIDNLDWMTPATKAKAQEKRRNFTTKIGHPDEWRDYSNLEIDRDDALGNLARANTWDYERRVGRLGGPVDRSEWFMTPQTVNAYHNPRLNEIVFPAAILQPPFFDHEADDAVNYGGIGAVIGHEIGHAFDDQGRKTDGEGNLNDWWTDEDAEAFKAKADALIAQYDAFEALPGLNVNGQLTLGENIGDLTGVYIGYKAYLASLKGKKAPVIDGLTGEQRFFMGFAQIWRAKAREEMMRRRVKTDPHSPPVFRTNGPLRNFTPFYEAFSVKEGDKMFLPEDQRVSIW